MKSSGISFALAFMWSFVLLIDIVGVMLGYEPDWVLVLCPLVTLVFDRWQHYIEDRMEEIHK